MKVLYKINLILIVLLSISTGLFKIMQQEADIQLFQVIGFNEIMTTIFGVIQLIGGVLMIIKKYRKIGALIMIPTYILATFVVFLNEMWAFGFFSIIFIVMAFLVYKKPDQSKM